MTNVLRRSRLRSLYFTIILLAIVLVGLYRPSHKYNSFMQNQSMGAIRLFGGREADFVWVLIVGAAFVALGAVVYEMVFDFQMYLGTRKVWGIVLGKGDENVTEDELRSQTNLYFWVLVGIMVVCTGTIVYAVRKIPELPYTINLFMVFVFLYFLTNSIQDWLKNTKEYKAFAEYLQTAEQLDPANEDLDPVRYFEKAPLWAQIVCNLLYGDCGVNA